MGAPHRHRGCGSSLLVAITPACVVAGEDGDQGLDGPLGAKAVGHGCEALDLVVSGHYSHTWTANQIATVANMNASVIGKIVHRVARTSPGPSLKRRRMSARDCKSAQLRSLTSRSNVASWASRSVVCRASLSPAASISARWFSSGSFEG